MTDSRVGFPSNAAYSAAAWLLRCEEATIRAVAEVEAGAAGAFLNHREPTILFERHLFHRLTGGRWDGHRVPNGMDTWSLISDPSPGGYGPVYVQHQRLHEASQLNREAALMSASWGLFQILGSNHAAAGYPTLQRFVNAMYREVDDHLRAFTMFIRHDDRLVDALRGKDWSSFAYVYNGPATKGYDVRAAQAYYRIASGKKENA